MPEMPPKTPIDAAGILDYLAHDHPILLKSAPGIALAGSDLASAVFMECDLSGADFSHADLAVYNQVQKLLYAGIIVVGILVVLSGLSIWKPVQLQWLTALFGGYDTARYVHFFCMAAIVAFLVIHVALALLVPKKIGRAHV